MECGGLTAAATTTTTTLDDLFSSHSTEVDVEMEWLSIFVEDCLSSKGSCLPPPKSSAGPTTAAAATSSTSDPRRPPRLRKPQNAPLSFHSSAVAGKARSKRKRIAAANSRTPLTNPWSLSLRHFPGSDPPLLDQAYWLAASELIAPKKAAEEEEEKQERSGGKVRYTASEQGKEDEEEDKGKGSSMGTPQPRRCTHCLSQRTPQWRAGPLGPKTLCNACGVRYKSGRLLPEYRPAKSPTFVSYLHSNSHKKVMEMRSGVGTESSILADEEKGC